MLILNSKTLIYEKVEKFIRKFYVNEIVKGTILFIALGLLYFFITLFIEYFLWLQPKLRLILFYTFVLVEFLLVLKFILYPLFKLVKIQKGINSVEASKIIGKHFQQIDDKLLNFIQLDTNASDSELMLASIEQKAQELTPFPFHKAVNLRENKKYIPFALLPILLVLFFYISGNKEIITDSFERVVQYNKTFIPPAPFQFYILNKDLNAKEGQDFLLRVETIGKVKPDFVSVVFNEQEYFMALQEDGSFMYQFTNLNDNVSFFLKGNDIISVDYDLKVVPIPTITDLEMVLDFPNHTNKKTEVINGTGNAEIPEGTKVSWRIKTKSTQNLIFSCNHVFNDFNKKDEMFSFSKTITNSLDYQIIAENTVYNITENTNFSLSVIKDQFPAIDVEAVSVKNDVSVYVGQVADDYGVSRLQFVYYDVESPEIISKLEIDIKKDRFDRFVFSIPDAIAFEKGKSYNFYFEVFDNDLVNNFKSSKSAIFNQKIKTDDEEQESLLNSKNASIKSLEKSLKNNEKQQSDLDDLKKIDKESKELNYKEQKKIQSALDKQKEVMKQMKAFSKELENNLEKFSEKNNDAEKEALLERFEKNQKDLEKNQELLEELQRLNDKLQQEELFDKIDELNKNSKTSQKNLEQLLELTKKYYVEQKLEQLVDKLDKLAEKQDDLSKKETKDDLQKQDALNKKFDDLQEDFRALEEENETLKKPIDLPTEEEQEDSIKEDMEKSSESLSKDEKEKAKKSQKSAADKMKQLAQSMAQSMEMSGAEQMEEDSEALRQILDNLLAFSFTQEDVLGQFKNMRVGAANFNKYLKQQQDLRVQFKHIDDSLFSLSLRNEKITDFVNEESGNIYYNIDNSLESLVDNNLAKGISHQQYTVASSNRLADFLSNILNQMQMQMNASGTGSSSPKPGKGKGAQLPDIIQKQQGLADKMKGKDKGSQKGEGEDGENGEPGSKPSKGKPKLGSQKGQGGVGSGDTSGEGEDNAKQLLEIFKEQRELRKQLEDQLSKSGLTPDGKKVLDQMKDTEKLILNKGFSSQVFQKMLEIKYNMLKLSDAMQQQEEDTKRSSNANKNEFESSKSSYSQEVQDYINSIEILNRQVLPLQPDFNKKVKTYFNTND